MEFDYIIVGGGSAGCVLASRLSADPNNKVLLLEAGGSHQSPFIQIPFLMVFTMPLWFKNWHYRTEPQPGLHNRRGYQPRGKALGGSSAINGMIYIRGQKEDYEEWAQSTSIDWAYPSVLPVFKKFERNYRVDDQYHGQEGELAVNDLISPNPASLAFVEAAKSCGYPLNMDFNGENQGGVGLYQVTQHAGKRCSSADAFLNPVLTRPNLKVMTHARVLKLLINGNSCQGVQVKIGANLEQIKAKKKVILTAGAMNSPHLLLLSGIGARQKLEPFGIPCLHELPGVGENFHDHPDYAHIYKSKHPDLLGLGPASLWKFLRAYNEYRNTAAGIMTTNFGEAGGFLSLDGKESRPNIQLHFMPGIVDNHCHKFHISRGMSLHFCVLRPKSRGRISLKSANPLHAPAIDPNLLAHDDDVNLMVRAYKLSLDIMEQEALAPYKGKALYQAKSEDEIRHLLRQRVDTVYHPVGSCRMGTDEMAVVNPHLHVHGIEGLMVADASIMPQIVSGNTNAPVMMIAEQAARFALERVYT